MTETQTTDEICNDSDLINIDDFLKLLYGPIQNFLLMSALISIMPEE